MLKLPDSRLYNTRNLTCGYSIDREPKRFEKIHNGYNESVKEQNNIFY